MGDRYEWTENCPNCGHLMKCYYAESCGITDVKCPNCKKEYDLCLTYKLIEKAKEKGR